MDTFFGGQYIHGLLIKPLYNIHLSTKATIFCACGEQSAKKVVYDSLGLVCASYSLPEWQAVKLTFFAPWERFNCINNHLFCGYF